MKNLQRAKNGRREKQAKYAPACRGPVRSAWEPSEDFNARARVVEEVRNLSEGASNAELRDYASYYSRHCEAQPEAFNSNREEPLVAATLVVTELRVSRSFDQCFFESFHLHISDLNYRRGYWAAWFDGYAVAQEGRG